MSWADDEIAGILKVNIWFYLGWNWVELLAIVVFSYRIRNVRDELDISLELFAIVGFWLTFSIVYIGSAFFFITYDATGTIQTAMPGPFQILIACCIQLRNLFTVSISSLFCLRAVQSRSLNNKTSQYGQTGQLKTLYDFELVLDSVLPLSYFKRYVETYEPQKGDLNRYDKYLEIYIMLKGWSAKKMRVDSRMEMPEGHRERLIREI
jgi:uncharacterized membrane protein